MTEDKNKHAPSFWEIFITEELKDILDLSLKDKFRVGRFCLSLILLLVNEDIFSLFSASMTIYLLYAGYGMTKTSIYKKLKSEKRIDDETEEDMNEISRESLRGLFEGAVLHEPQIVIAQNGSKVTYKEVTLDKEEKPQVTDEQIANAVQKNQSMFWAQSAWAVFFCVCRDYLGMTHNMTEMEQYIKGLPFSQALAYECPEGTIQKALSNNAYMKLSIDKWKTNGGKERAILLAEKLIADLGVK